MFTLPYPIQAMANGERVTIPCVALRQLGLVYDVTIPDDREVTINAGQLRAAVADANARLADEMEAAAAAEAERLAALSENPPPPPAPPSSDTTPPPAAETAPPAPPAAESVNA